MSARSVLRILSLIRTNLDLLDAFVDTNKLIKESEDRVDFLDRVAGEIAPIAIKSGSKSRARSTPKNKKTR